MEYTHTLQLLCLLFRYRSSLLHLITKMIRILKIQCYKISSSLWYCPCVTLRNICKRKHLGFYAFVSIIVYIEYVLVIVAGPQVNPAFTSCNVSLGLCSSVQLVNGGEDVLVFYNDRSSFPVLLEMMGSERDRGDLDGALAYHNTLVELLAACTEGKNVYTELKCNSLLPLDDIVKVVTNINCIPEVKA